MAGGHGVQFDGGFRQGNVEAALALGGAGEEELQRERGLAGPGRAFDEIDAVAGQAAAEDVIEASDTRAGKRA